MPRTAVKKVSNLTYEEAKELRKLTVRGWTMAPALDMCRDNEEGFVARVIDNGKTLAWGLYMPYREGVYLYTPPKERRKGYGRRVMRALIKRFGNVIVVPHDNRSKAFFDNFPEVEYNDIWGYSK